MKNSVSARFKVFNTFLYLIAIASAILSTIGVIVNYWPILAIFKTLYMPSISLLVYMHWNEAHDRQYQLLQIAFLFAWLGDIAILFDKLHLIVFVIGGLLFLVQQILYIIINVRAKHPQNSLLKAPYWGLPSMVYIVCYNLIYWAPAPLDGKIIATIYCTFLATGFYTSFCRGVKNQLKYFACILGFTFFIISDILIGYNQFVEALNDEKASLILITYYIAQAFISYSNIPDTVEGINK